jgi:hypothetical protein
MIEKRTINSTDVSTIFRRAKVLVTIPLMCTSVALATTLAYGYSGQETQLANGVMLGTTIAEFSAIVGTTIARIALHKIVRRLSAMEP